jgi:hypothetical protein
MEGRVGVAATTQYTKASKARVGITTFTNDIFDLRRREGKRVANKQRKRKGETKASATAVGIEMMSGNLCRAKCGSWQCLIWKCTLMFWERPPTRCALQ